MTAPSGGGPGSQGASAPGEDRRATVAGAVLVVVAVVIGLILLGKGFSDDGGFLSAGKKSSGTSATSTTTLSHSTTTTQAVDPATVKVYVANASGKSGAAGKVSAVLAGKQYPTPAVGDAATAATTMVYFLPGSEAQAQLVATSLNLPTTSVAPMPSPAPVASLGSATVLVVIGTDGALNAVESGNPTTTAPRSTTTAAKSTTTTKKP